MLGAHSLALAYLSHEVRAKCVAWQFLASAAGEVMTRGYAADAAIGRAELAIAAAPRRRRFNTSSMPGDSG
jgi:hypothetical protein